MLTLCKQIRLAQDQPLRGTFSDRSVSRKQSDKLGVWRTEKELSLRTSAHAGVAIPRLEGSV